jgi:hypothetical protein
MMAPREVSLTPIRAQVAQLFPPGAVTRGDVEWAFDLDRLHLRLTRYVLSERLADETVRWPATWWDAFKERWVPGWWLRRWPATYAHADFTVYRGYPDLALPRERHTLFIQRQWPEA